MSTPRLAAVAALALLTAGCPNPRNPLGPPIDTPGPGPGATIAFRLGEFGADAVKALATDPAGNIFVAGEFTGSVDFDPSSASRILGSLGGTDVFVARYTPVGDLTWAIRIGGGQDISVNALALDGGGNLLIGGGFAGTANFDPAGGVTSFTSNGGRDAYVASFTAAGGLRWARGFGGTLDDQVLSVTLQAEGTAFASGTFAGTMPVDPGAGIAVTSIGDVDGFLASWNLTGTARWAFSVGGPGADSAAATAPAPGGGVYLGGSFTGTADFGPGTTAAALTSLGGYDAFLARYTPGGELAWVRGLHGSSMVRIGPNGLAAAPDGALVATGTFAGTADFNAGTAVAALTSAGLNDGFIVRHAASGDFGWTVAMGGFTNDVAGAVAVAPNGEVAVTGSFTGVARFDPGAAATGLTALGISGATDMYVARYSASGAFRWAVGIGGPLVGESFLTAGTSVAADPNGNVVAGGRFFGSVDVNPGTTLTVLSSLGNADGLVVKYTGTGELATRP
ncbi:MAG: hypothetical protein ABR551_08765 [Gemmatimonadales bacterium]